eukprot:CAMPEP_0119171302 /NCGR_PEP_ID=MMETSP1315-20130426/24060_1 /TAXON_ID=676789 /ORGANISM="Prasinoderma singularis, Strain RCC927" /LENGTH=104 /DNA_ID=CAMNT_0007165125 /DNA_START=284 /DNA_END=596 /DNA_ORIENTATION=+
MPVPKHPQGAVLCEQLVGIPVGLVTELQHASHASRCIAASAVRSFRGAHFRKTPAAAARARSASGSSGAALTERSASSSASLAPAASSSPSHFNSALSASHAAS